eukprot:GHVT01082754.1.p1 GENE.GHVT01082754.1~~GHVT01082754.1.p1  ORF type:complete len:158 (+),score=15.96 GHVT01082754.1:336-809(+)
MREVPSGFNIKIGLKRRTVLYGVGSIVMLRVQHRAVLVCDAFRDVGSVVCPWATVKLFVTADVGERARRRHLELQRRQAATFAEEHRAVDIASTGAPDINTPCGNPAKSHDAHSGSVNVSNPQQVSFTKKYADILVEMERRDARDANRKTAPLRKAE